MDFSQTIKTAKALVAVAIGPLLVKVTAGATKLLDWLADTK